MAGLPFKEWSQIPSNTKHFSVVNVTPKKQQVGLFKNKPQNINITSGHVTSRIPGVGYKCP